VSEDVIEIFKQPLSPGMLVTWSTRFIKSATPDVFYNALVLHERSSCRWIVHVIAWDIISGRCLMDTNQIAFASNVGGMMRWVGSPLVVDVTIILPEMLR
jgi:hypothetical protein